MLQLMDWECSTLCGALILTWAVSSHVTAILHFLFLPLFHVQVSLDGIHESNHESPYHVPAKVEINASLRGGV